MMYLWWLNEHGVRLGPEFYMLSWCKKSVQIQDACPMHVEDTHIISQSYSYVRGLVHVNIQYIW